MVNLNYATIGKRIKARRKELHLTQSELGKRVNLSESSVSKYEHGKVPDATTGKFTKFAEALQVDVAWLLGIENKKEETPLKLTTEETQLINAFRKLPQDKQIVIKDMIVIMARDSEEAATTEPVKSA